jgi:hypothetical protein
MKNWHGVRNDAECPQRQHDADAGSRNKELMMNFVETAPVMAPRLSVAKAPATPAAAPVVAGKARAFGTAFGLSVAVFTFTLIGLITTVNVATDHYVIPHLYGPQAHELSRATMDADSETQDTAAVETTAAR